jgi:uncharacterized protein DUF2442
MSDATFPIEMVDVVNVQPRGAHRLFVRFSNGNEGECDLLDVVGQGGPMVQPLRDATFFSRVFIEDGVLTWPNGFDVDSIALHQNMKAAGLLHRSAA